MKKQMSYILACEAANKAAHTARDTIIEEVFKHTGRSVHVIIAIMVEPDPGGVAKNHVASSMRADELPPILEEMAKQAKRRLWS